MQDIAVTESTLAELEAVIEHGQQTFIEVGLALLAIRDRRLYRDQGHSTFEDYCQKRWGWQRAHAYRMIDSAKVAAVLSPMGDMPETERQARELTPIMRQDPAHVAEVWHEVKQRFGDDVTAADVRTVVQEHMPPKPELSTYEFNRQQILEANRQGACIEVPATQADGMAVHYSSETPEWYTPKPIIERVRRSLGQIDLDPCSNTGTPNVPALQRYTVQDDGLAHDWRGKVYMNPPYGRAIAPWIEKFRQEYTIGNMTAGIALVPARTDTDWFRMLNQYAICFIDGRLHFNDSDAGAPFPSCAVYAGDDIAGFAFAFGEIGDVWVRWEDKR